MRPILFSILILFLLSSFLFAQTLVDSTCWYKNEYSGFTVSMFYVRPINTTDWHYVSGSSLSDVRAANAVLLYPVTSSIYPDFLDWYCEWESGLGVRGCIVSSDGVRAKYLHYDSTRDISFVASLQIENFGLCTLPDGVVPFEVRRLYCPIFGVNDTESMRAWYDSGGADIDCDGIDGIDDILGMLGELNTRGRELSYIAEYQASFLSFIAGMILFFIFVRGWHH